MSHRHFWERAEFAARRAVTSCTFWGDVPNRTIDVTPYVNGKRDLRALEDVRHTFIVPELGSLGYPTHYALRVDAHTGLASIFLDTPTP